MDKSDIETAPSPSQIHSTPKIESNSTSRPFSRRFVLRAGLVGALASLAVPSIVNKSADTLHNLTMTPDQRLEKYDLTPFKPFLEVYDRLAHDYFTHASYMITDDAIYTDPGEILEAIGRGESDNQVIDAIKSGWGEKTQAESVTDALSKVEKTTIQVDHGLPISSEQAKIYYQGMAKLLPWHILAAPDKLHLTAGGGEYVAIDYPDFRIQAQLQVASPRLPGSNGVIDNLDQFLIAGTHELGHAESNWLKSKAYVSRDKFIGYITREAQAIYNVLDEYYSLSWEEAQVYKDGGIGQPRQPLVLFYDTDKTTLSNVEALEKLYQDKYGIILPPLSNDPIRQQRFAESDRFNRLIWATGHAWREILKKKQQGMELPPKEKVMASLDNSDEGSYYVTLFLQRAGQELHHYFRGPAGPDNGQAMIDGVAKQSMLITEAMAVQQTRFRTFSTLPEEALSDPALVFDNFKKTYAENLPKI